MSLRLAAAAVLSVVLHLWLLRQDILSSLPEIPLRSYPVSMELSIASAAAPAVRTPPKIVEPPAPPPPAEEAEKPLPRQTPFPSVKSPSPPAPAERGVAQARPLPGQPPPAYPLAAQYRHIEGTVLLEVQVLPDGRPGAIRVARSSGSSLLDKAAAAGVREWRFEPAREGQSPVAATIQIPVVFELQ